MTRLWCYARIMCFLWRLMVIWMGRWSLMTHVKADDNDDDDDDFGATLLTPGLKNAVAVWAAGFENPVFVLHELDATIPCSNKTTEAEPTSTPVWLNEKNQELDKRRLRPSPSGRVLHANNVELEDTGRYVCRLEVPGKPRRVTIPYWHHLIVYSMPTLTMEISLSYMTPTCREDRMKQRMESFLPRFGVWPATRDEYRILRYTCAQ